MKLKYHSLYGQLLQDRMLMNAWKQVRRGVGSVQPLDDMYKNIIPRKGCRS